MGRPRDGLTKASPVPNPGAPVVCTAAGTPTTEYRVGCASWLDHSLLEYLASLSRRLPGWAVAVEFRHETWLPQRAEEVLAFLAQDGLTVVALDCPWPPYLPVITAPEWAAVRLHGRNVKGWLDQLAGKEPTVGEKYDYRYSAEELAEVATWVRAYQGQVRRVGVTFNNKDDCPIVNVLDLKRLLGLPGPGDRESTRPPGSDVAGSPEGDCCSDAILAAHGRVPGARRRGP